jgi:DNA-binding NarL/FixJ family response regulator/anti-sigma regulatory factor (Ser/Thr protein kinase)
VEELAGGWNPPPSFAMVKDEINDLKHMVLNILDSEKILLKKALYNHDRIINLSEIVMKNTRSCQSFTALRIQTDIEPELFTCMAPTAFKRVYTNIIGNAIKFTPRGSIGISLKDGGGVIHFTVKDTGIGIEPEALKHIFDSYYQKPAQFTNEYQGIGAGLPVVKGIIDEVGGTITITSQVNSGTTVHITFKKTIITSKNKDMVLEDIPMAAPIKKRNFIVLTEKYDKNKKTILVIDDSKKFQQLLHYGLKNEFNVYYADNGREALLTLQLIRKPDIIFCDIIMPVMDGWEFFKKLQTMKEFQDIPFIFLTSISTQAEKIKGIKAGAVNYIYKPCSIEEIKEIANSLITSYEINRKKEKERTFKDLGELLDRKREDDDLFETFDMKCAEFKITGREKEVLLLVLQGKDNPDIADILYISILTVKSHMRSLYQKTEIKKRSELISFFNTKEILL